MLILKNLVNPVNNYFRTPSNFPSHDPFNRLLTFSYRLFNLRLLSHAQSGHFS